MGKMTVPRDVIEDAGQKRRKGEGKQGDGHTINGHWCKVQQSGVEEEPSRLKWVTACDTG